MGQLYLANKKSKPKTNKTAQLMKKESQLPPNVCQRSKWPICSNSRPTHQPGPPNTLQPKGLMGHLVIIVLRKASKSGPSRYLGKCFRVHLHRGRSWHPRDGGGGLHRRSREGGTVIWTGWHRFRASLCQPAGGAPAFCTYHSCFREMSRVSPVWSELQRSNNEVTKIGVASISLLPGARVTDMPMKVAKRPLTRASPGALASQGAQPHPEPEKELQDQRPPCWDAESKLPPHLLLGLGREV